MRQIAIDFRTSPIEAGYLGEHNATEIVVAKPADLSGSQFSVAFQTNGEVIHSKYFSADEEIRVSLWQQLTQDNVLGVQLESYDENGAYIGKSATVRLLLKNSVHGTDVVADADNPDVYSEIAQNSNFRETLEDNVNTLDKLTTSETGKLLFDGKLIEGSGGGSASIDVEVKTETEDEYVLEFIVDTETITTPNLKGKQGVQGEQGVSGVYVGSGEMPDGYNVQIDPTGEAVVIPTKTSQLENDSGFITADDLPEMNLEGYAKKEEVYTKEQIDGKGFITAQDLPKSEHINVKDFGAVGDGVTDDTAAIKTAIASVPENGTLYFPIGVYRVDNIMLKSNMIVKGDGKGSVVKLNNNAPLTNVDEYDDYWNNCFTIYQTSNVTIENIALDGNKENNSATGAATDYRLNGVIIQKSTDIILNRIYAYNNGYHGCIMSDDVYRVEISDSEFYNNGFRPFHGHGTIVDCKFINNRCVNNGLGVSGDTTTGYDGLFFFDDCQRLLINGNYVETNTNAGIDLGGSVLGNGSDTSEYKGSSNIIVTNNIIKKTDTSTKTPSGIQLIPALLDKVTIEGNTIMDCRFGVRGQESSYSPLGSYINICNNIFRTTYGIYCPVVLKYANISNNQFVTCPEGGVILAGATDTQITGNMFETIGAWTSATDKDGIVMTNCKRTIIANNRFYNKSTGHWAQYGVKEKGSTDTTLIIGNTFQDMAVSAYLFVGANSKAVNNIVNGVLETTI